MSGGEATPASEDVTCPGLCKARRHVSDAAGTLVGVPGQVLRWWLVRCMAHAAQPAGGAMSDKNNENTKNNKNTKNTKQHQEQHHHHQHHHQQKRQQR